MKFNKLFLIALFSSIFFVSCDPEEDTPPFYTSKGTYDSGVLVLNEGQFGKTDASISYISFDLNTNTNNIFGLANNVNLGETGQSIGFYNDLAYIVVNGGDKIEVVNRYSMQKVATISSGLNSPRYITFTNGKGYVTCWGEESISSDDYVAVVNLSNNGIITSIPVVEGPEKMIDKNGTLYVSHHGGWGYGSKLSIINTASNTVSSTISVGDVPVDMEIDGNFLWVLCEGKSPYSGNETGGKLQKINLTNNGVEETFTFTTTSHPRNLNLYNDALYYSVGDTGIYKMKLTPVAPATSISLPTSTLLNVSGAKIYGLAIKNNKIYVGDSPAFDQNGRVIVYSLGEGQDSPALGTLLKTINVGIAPRGFYFNQ